MTYSPILLVDDRPENILPLKKILEMEGFRTESANSGEDALRKILKNTYSLIILDVQMPGMDGFEVAEHISSFNRSKNTPIIFLSALSKEKKYITKGLSSGGIDYLTKPVDPDVLILKVQTFVRLFEQQQELKRIHDVLEQEVAVRKKAQNRLTELNNKLEEKVAARTQELEEKNKKLESINHELQQFTWVVSHDLKEPARKIQTFNNLLKDRYVKDADGIKLLERSIVASLRMAELIEDLLDYSRLSANNRFIASDFNVIIRQLVNEMQEDTEFPILLEMEKIPIIEAVPGQIRQVFQNLFSNAVKFRKKDQVAEISIMARLVTTLSPESTEDSSGQYCRITVKDKGIGFDQQFAQKIFVIFQRLYDQKDAEGTGIGLAIVKKIINTHNGYISATGVPGKGAEFNFILPLKQITTLHEQVIE